MKQERANASAKALKRSEKRSASSPKPLSQEKYELPVRKPFGQEDSDDDDHDDEDMLASGHRDTGDQDEDDQLIIDQDMAEQPDHHEASGQDVDMDEDALRFQPISASALAASQAGADNRAYSQVRKVPIPPHRMSPLKRDWPKIYTPLVEQAGLMVRMNVRTRAVEIKSSKYTEDLGVIQKACDFVKAYALGFDADDALALLRLDDLYVDSFEMKDVKTLHGDHLSRAIGRIAGKDGRTRFAIENASRTRIVLADTKIHILGAYQNIRMAKDSIVALIMGSPPGKVYAKLRTVSARMRQRA